MPLTVKKVQQRLAKLDAERDRKAAELKRIIAARKTFVDDLRTVIQDVDGLRTVIQDVENDPSEGEARPAAPGNIMGDAIVRILQESDQPMHYKQIHQELQRRHVTVAGQNPAKNVGAHLSLDKCFVSQGVGLWGLAEVPDLD